MSQTSKYKIAEQSLAIIKGGHPTDDAMPTIRELILFVSQAFSAVVRNAYFESRNEGEPFINGSFIFTFKDVPVSKDTDLDKFFSTMPQTTITLPYDLGVYHVSLMEEQQRPFVPVPNGFLGLSRGLESGKLEGRMGYYIEGSTTDSGSRLYYVNMKAQDKPTKVLLKLVAPIGQVGDDDPIGIPEDIQLEIVTMTVKMFQGGQTHDEINDNING